MKKLLIYIIAFVPVLMFSGLFARAQMTGNMHPQNKGNMQSHGQMMMNDSTYDDNHDNMVNVMENVSARSDMMMKDVTTMENHLQAMMKIKDIDKLKEELKKHEQMLSNLEKSMKQQTQMHTRMESMLEKNQMHSDILGEDNR